VTQLHGMVKTECRPADRLVIMRGKLCCFGSRNSRASARSRDANYLRVPVMNELEITRLNVERYRRMLQIEVDETARQAIKNILEEFEAKLASLKPLRR